MSQPPADQPEVTPDVFQPSKGRILFAAAVAIGAFFIPQEIPLEYYPLNNPGTDINYLEIACAADKNGGVQFYYNATQGIKELHSIYWPISPTEQTFTYTFPLLDAPITELRLDPVADGGALTIRQMRIINRREEEIRRFRRDSFVPVQQVAAIDALDEGWKITSVAGSNDPFLNIGLASPIVPVGMNVRNLKRCVLSTSYLAMMLTILLLAVFFAFRRPEPWRQTVSSIGFLALLGLMFSFVGNRGLIRNSVSYARFIEPAVSHSFTLELDLNMEKPGVGQLFWDTGKGISQEESKRVNYEGTPGEQTARFPLPATHLHGLRFDPMDGAGEFTIRRARVVDGNGNVRLVLPLETFEAANQISSIEMKDEVLKVATTTDANDPIVGLRREAVDRINALVSGKQ